MSTVEGGGGCIRCHRPRCWNKRTTEILDRYGFASSQGECGCRRRMLHFAADIDGKRTVRHPSRQSRNIVKTLLLGTAEVVVDRLPIVIAVGQRFAHDLSTSCVG